MTRRWLGHGVGRIGLRSAGGLMLLLALGAGAALAAPVLSNTVGGSFSFIGGCTSCGGDGNSTFDDFNTVAGGQDNTTGTNNGTATDAPHATVSGGFRNAASARYSTVAGGLENHAVGYGSTVGGGEVNAADGVAATVGGGTVNAALGVAATVGGGYYNVAAGDFATIAGGGTSTSGPGGTGTANRATDDYATVGGGGNNQAGNGTASTTDATYGTVAGGRGNQALGYASAVAGGNGNQATAGFGAVGGGSTNAAAALGATVPGGVSNRAGGQYSLAAGRQAKVSHQGAFVWADSTAKDFPSAAANEFAARATGGVRLVSAVDATTGVPTAGVKLAAGSGSWSTLSDRNLKANFRPVDGRDILQRLVSLPVSTWTYQAQDEGVRHMGPTAQDFRQAFGLGEDDKTISTVDEQGVALAAIQGLYATTRQENAELRARISALEQRQGSASAPPALPELPLGWAVAFGGLAIGAGLFGGLAVGLRRR